MNPAHKSSNDLFDPYSVRPYYVPMNVTLSLDEALVQRARKLAHQRGTSLNQLVRDHLEELTASSDPLQAFESLETLWVEDPARPDPDWKWKRSAAYDRTVLR